MIELYIMQYNDQSRYLVVMKQNIYVSVYKYEKYKFDQPFQAKNIFIGDSNVCPTTEFSGALNNPNFDGNTILLECEDSKYIYISGLDVFKFRTDDKILDYITLMGNNMIPYTFVVGDRYTYFISTHYNYFENVKIQKGTLLHLSNDSMDPYDYHLSKNSLNCFKELLEYNQIHSFWPDMQSGDMEEIIEDEEVVEEDDKIHELEYTYGSNEVVKISNQNCVLCLERDSDFIFKQCGHQCICEECYQNKGDIKIFKCSFCET